MLVSGVQQSESIMYIYTYIFYFSFSHIAITEHWVEFPVLYSESFISYLLYI